MEKSFKAFRFCDVFLYLAVGILFLSLFFIIKPNSSEKVKTCVLEVEGSIVFTYDYTLNLTEIKSEKVKVTLDGDAELIVKVSYGEHYNEVVIYKKDSAVKISDADCPTLVCVNTGKVSKVNTPITCVPHNLVVTLRGE